MMHGNSNIKYKASCCAEHNWHCYTIVLSTTDTAIQLCWAQLTLLYNCAEHNWHCYTIIAGNECLKSYKYSDYVFAALSCSRQQNPLQASQFENNRDRKVGHKYSSNNWDWQRDHKMRQNVSTEMTNTFGIKVRKWHAETGLPSTWFEQQTREVMCV